MPIISFSSSRARSIRGWIVLGLVLVAGCTLGEGLAGNGTFEYVCSNTKADPACGELLQSTMPSSIARGARFRLKFTDKKAEARGVVEPVSSEVIVRKGGDFIAQRTGLVGFIVKDGDVFVDAFRVNVVEPSGLRVLRVGGGWLPSPTDAVVVEEGTSFVTQALDENGRPIAGTMTPTWSVDDPSLFTVFPKQDGSCGIALTALVGTTWLRAAVGGWTAAIRIQSAQAAADAWADLFKKDGGAEAGSSPEVDAGTDGGGQ
jgi:hypothetical protein